MSANKQSRLRREYHVFMLLGEGMRPLRLCLLQSTNFVVPLALIVLQYKSWKVTICVGGYSPPGQGASHREPPTHPHAKPHSLRSTIPGTRNIKVSCTI